MTLQKLLRTYFGSQCTIAAGVPWPSKGQRVGTLHGHWRGYGCYCAARCLRCFIQNSGREAEENRRPVPPEKGRQRRIHAMHELHHEDVTLRNFVCSNIRFGLWYTASTVRKEKSGSVEKGSGSVETSSKHMFEVQSIPLMYTRAPRFYNIDPRKATFPHISLTECEMHFCRNRLALADAMDCVN